MNRSEGITKLAVSLVKFNSEVSSISKDAQNPFFKSDYVTLDKLIIATREILQKNGLSVMQMPLSKETGEIGIQTILLHESGEYIESDPLFMKPVKNDPQGAGSLITYLRRYSYQSILNLNTGEDDDGNNSSVSGNPDKTNSKEPDKKPDKKPANNKPLSDAQIKRLYAIAKSHSLSPDDIKKVMMRNYKKESTKDLTRKEYDEIIERIEKK